MDEFDINPTKTLEIGCGYGRLSPWIANHGCEHHGIDPNGEMISRARSLYPDIHWQVGSIQDSEYAPDEFDFIYAWTVLQHIPPEDIEAVARNIVSTLQPGGYLLLCEEVSGEVEKHLWPRPVERYDELFRELSLVKSQDRTLEPTAKEEPSSKILLFENDASA